MWSRRSSHVVYTHAANDISFELAGGYETTCRFLKAVRLCTLVEHVGSVETLLTHPASMTHADVPREQLAAVGLTPGLVRLSVGLEEPAGILADLFQAFSAALADATPAIQPEGDRSCALTSV